MGVLCSTVQQVLDPLLRDFELMKIIFHRIQGVNGNYDTMEISKPTRGLFAAGSRPRRDLAASYTFTCSSVHSTKTSKNKK